MDRPSLYLASICYGGLASAGFMRAVLDLRAACAARDIPLQLDLMGGEALASRGEAMILRRFLTSGATHLLMTEGGDFDPTRVVAELTDPTGVTGDDPVLLARHELISMRAKSERADSNFGDVRGATSSHC